MTGGGAVLTGGGVFYSFSLEGEGRDEGEEYREMVMCNIWD